MPDYCTIATAAGLGQALHLRDSLHRVRPDANFHLLVAEHPAEVARLRTELKEVPLLAPDQIGCQAWVHMAFFYDPSAYGAALRPWLLRALLRRGDVVYLDPDIEVLSPPEALEQALWEVDLVVAPELRGHRDPAVMKDQALLGVRKGATTDELMLRWGRALAKPPPCGDPCDDGFWAAAFASLSPRLLVLRGQGYRVGGQEERPAASSFATYHDGTPIPPSHRAAFLRLHPANRRPIQNPFIERGLLTQVVAQSAAVDVHDSQRDARGAAAERMNTAPPGLVSCAMTALGRFIPRSRTRDLVYNAIRDAASGARRLYDQVGQVRHA
jgi:hypothetical protein